MSCQQAKGSVREVPFQGRRACGGITMTELLFKLKKDGKTVGYLELVGNVPSPKTAAERPLTAIAGLRWYNAQKTIMAIRDIEIQWDSAHPFVTKDKNGKDVFANDNVYLSEYTEFAAGGEVKHAAIKLECEIQWQQKYCRWICFWEDSEDGPSYVLIRPKHIELIEDKG
jgi:hypothetical protein